MGLPRPQYLKHNPLEPRNKQFQPRNPTEWWHCEKVNKYDRKKYPNMYVHHFFKRPLNDRSRLLQLTLTTTNQQNFKKGIDLKLLGHKNNPDLKNYIQIDLKSPSITLLLEYRVHFFISCLLIVMPNGLLGPRVLVSL